jgi:hypothetical protein
MRIASLALLWTLTAVAQSPQATITGLITDPQGAAIVAARVSALNVATQVRTEVETNEAGLYSLRQLPIGGYEIAVERDGFRRHVRSGVLLTTGQSLELNVQLELGAVSESVSVSAVASRLDTRTSDVTQLVESRTIEDMPLGDRRTMNLIRTMGAAVFVNYDAGSKPNFSLAGGRTQSQVLWIDGGSGQNMRLGVGQFDIDPPVETTQEVKVLSNNYSAEYGGSAGGVIVAATRSGTNQFHGSLFEYLRNEKLDAANFFAPLDSGEKVRPPLRYNVFGGTLGGRIIRDKTFFFFSYEGSRRRDGDTRTLTVPTQLERSGDFSRTFDARGNPIPIYDPFSNRTEGGRVVRDPFTGNRIPGSRLDPVGVNLMPFYPAANRPPDNITGANNFRANYVTILNRDNYLAKVDHNIGSRDKITGRYMYNSDNRNFTSVFPNPAADTLAPQPAHQQFWFSSWTRVVSPTLVNDLRMNIGDRHADARSFGLGGNWPSQIGLKGVPDGAFPTITTSGVATLGAGTHRRLSTPIRQQQIVNNVSLVLGKHTMKFGGEFKHSRIVDILQTSISGNFSFNPLSTGQPGVAASGIGLASLLAGVPLTFSTRETQPLDRSSWYIAGFFQDDWNLSRTLTLNFGIRWEVDTPIVDANQRMNGFDTVAINPVSRTPGVIKFAGVGGWRNKPFDMDLNNFAPRFGFAWKPGGAEQTVVRGGYGIFFAHPYDTGVPNSASLGYEISSNLTSPDNGVTAPFILRNGVPANPVPPQLDDSFGAVPVGRSPTTAVTFYESNRVSGYAHQFNLGIQRELPGHIIVEVSYLANLGRKLSNSTMPINQIRPELLGPGVAQKDRPFPQFSNVSVLLPPMSITSYNAGLVRVEKRFSGGLNLLATYTWSKFLNNSFEGGSVLGAEGGTYSDLYNRKADYGPSENDIPHRFTLSSVYELPFGSGRRFLSASPLRWVFGDWSVGTVATLQSGPPFTVTTQVNSTNAFSAGSLRADVSRNPNLPGAERALGRWFDIGAFSQPAIYRFGNQGVNILRADGTINFDFSVLKNFPVREGQKLQLRGELFNAFNNANFLIPGRVFGAAGFGLVSNAQPMRRVQLGLRYVF